MRLLIDGNHMASRARFGSDVPLTTNTGRPSNTLFVFLRSLAFILNEVKCSYHNVSVVWDGGHSPYRTKLFPEYKRRDPVPIEEVEQAEIDKRAYFDQINELHTLFLPALGIQSIRFPRCEADDVLAVYACQIAEWGAHQVFILSGDKDFHQLVDGRIYQIDGKNNTLTVKEVEERWGVYGHEVPNARALIGDDSDNISGVKGIGEVRAKAVAPWVPMILNGNIGSMIEQVPKKDQKYVLAAQECKEIIERNVKLMTLPRDFSNEVFPFEEMPMHMKDQMWSQLYTRPQRNLMEFFQACRKWDFNLANDALCSI